jgi:ectoine hydroxylase-related dioxygenase (phytanoyl-CoA dioxygenase family)
VRTVWIAIDDVDALNGGLCILPRRHRSGRLPLRRLKPDTPAAELERRIALAGHYVFECDLEAAGAPPGEVHQYTIRAGGMAMHHPLTPHCSGPNASEHRERRVVILRYMAEGEPHEPGRLPCYRHGSSCTFEKQTFQANTGDGLVPAPPPRSTQCSL